VTFGVPTAARSAAMALGLCIGFTLSVALSCYLTREAQGVAALWTANAFLITALLILPPRLAAASAAVCALANVGVYLAVGDRGANPYVFTLINLFEACAVAWIARRVCGKTLRITDLSRLARLLALAVLPACGLAASLAATYLSLTQGKPWMVVWPDWFIADAAGLAIMLPAIFALRARTLGEFKRGPLETTALYALVAVATAAVFGETALPLPFLVYGALTLIAFRLGPKGAVIGALVAAALALPLAIGGFGVLRAFDQLDAARRIHMTQIYILAAFYTGFVTATAVEGQLRLRRLFLQRIQVARRSRARAMAASAAKTDFLATMSHEIRTPMNSIVGFTRLLLDAPDIPPEARRKLGLIDSASATLLSVVNDILDFSKVEAGEVELDIRATTVRRLAEDTVAIAAESAAQKGLALSLTFDGPVDQAHWADDMRIRQVILNLLNNAVKFTKSGRVELSAEVLPGEHVDTARFAITDTGIGIPLDRRDRLFERFSQVDSTVTRTHGGTGLGLAICKGLVELMDGEIGVRSEPGKGSTFWFEVPLGRSGSAALQDAPAVAGGPIAARILLVDDHPMNRELGSTLLTLMGCEVDLAEDGLQAVEAARTGAYDAILMDVHMPHMDGLAATRAIIDLGGRAAETPIIAMTADVLPEHVERCRMAGMVDHVAKPVRPEALHAALARWAVPPDVPAVTPHERRTA
jgi:signal transduction histidine kinase/ActR/RegA family two-component response regulator